MRQLASTLLAITLAAPLGAAGPKMNPVPETAASTAEIKKAVAAFKGFGHVETAHFDLRFQEVFVLWYCPFSGEDSSYLHAYWYDAETKNWKLFVNELVRSSHDLSPSIPTSNTELVITDTQGKAVRHFDIRKLMREKKDRE